MFREPQRPARLALPYALESLCTGKGIPCLIRCQRTGRPTKTLLQARGCKGVYLVRENGAGERPRRVAIYCRVSTSDQDCDRQERDLVEYAERAGYEVVGVYKETLSGVRKSRGKQPVERAKAMALAQRREIDAVLVTELTRWGRSTQDLMGTLGELASWGASLIAQTGLTFSTCPPPRAGSSRASWRRSPNSSTTYSESGYGRGSPRAGVRAEGRPPAVEQSRPRGVASGAGGGLLAAAGGRAPRDLEDHGQRDREAE